MDPNRNASSCGLKVLIDKSGCVQNDDEVEEVAAVDGQWSEIVRFKPGQHIFRSKEIEMGDTDQLLPERLKQMLTVKVIVGCQLTLAKGTIPSKHSSRSKPCGLINYKNNCFANVALQCISLFGDLYMYLLTNQYGTICDKEYGWCFTCDLQHHLRKAETSSEPFKPNGVLDHLKEFGTDFEDGLSFDKHFDASEFLSLGIEQIKTSERHPTSKAICVDIFGGKIKTEYSCRCGKSKPHVRVTPFTVLNIAMKNRRCTSLCGHLFDYTKRIKKGGPVCGCGKNKTSQTTIHEAPKILILTLARFEFQTADITVKKAEPIDCPMYLDITHYMSSDTRERDPENSYELFGAIIHEGVGVTLGHYTCYTRFNEKWYYINDQQVQEVDADDALKKIRNAYTLIYKRKTGTTSVSQNERASEHVTNETNKGSSEAEASSTPPDDQENTFTAGVEKDCATEQWTKETYNDPSEAEENSAEPDDQENTVTSDEDPSVKKEPIVHLGDKLFAGRALRRSKEKLDSKYVILQDRPALEVAERIKEALRDCQPDIGKYVFHLLPYGDVVYAKRLKALCLSTKKKIQKTSTGKKRRQGPAVRTISTDQKKGKAVATRMYHILQDVLHNLTLPDDAKKDQRGSYYGRKERIYESESKYLTSLNLVCQLLRTTRLSMNISNSSWGLISGPVIMYSNGLQVIDCSVRNTWIPYDSPLINSIALKGEVKFILVVEKHSVFTMLEGMDFTKRYQCILVTARGHSDIATRSILHKLYAQLGVTVYGFADCNPAGATILLTLKYGSIKKACDNLELTTPGLRWIGLEPSFIKAYPGACARLSDDDKKKIRKLLTGPRPLCEEETTMLNEMLTDDQKADIETVLDEYTILEFLAARIRQMREVSGAAVRASPCGRPSSGGSGSVEDRSS